MVKIKNKDPKFSKVDKKLKEHKDKFIEKIQRLTSEQKQLYFLKIENIVSADMFILREKLKEYLHFLTGKHKLILHAFKDLNVSEKHVEKLQAILKTSQDVYLVFSNFPIDEIKALIENQRRNTQIKPGDKATEEIVIPKGPIDFLKINPDTKLAHTNNVLQLLTKLGVGVRLLEGQIVCDKEFYLTRFNQEVNVEQVKILKMIGKKIGSVNFKWLAKYDKGTIEKLK